MLKIYFDWNCITHSKEKYPYILSIAEECRDRFIFPFSNAHLRDLLVSHTPHNKFYQADLDIFERICGNHYLLFENGQMTPKIATPSYALSISGNMLEIIQHVAFITPEMYSSIKDDIRKQIPHEIYAEIQGADPKDVIYKIDKYISQNLPEQNLESLMSKYQTNQGKLANAEARFKSMCMALDMFGFRPEKKGKTIMNIDTDASHIFYAGHCDIFVTADSKLRGKAEAMYQKYNYQTRILHPKEFEAFIDSELPKEYSIKYISEVIDNYGIPRIETDGAHYKLLPSQIFGMFNVCHKLDSNWGYEGSSSAGLFRYAFNNTPYLYYDELTHFCDVIEKLLSPSEKKIFREGFMKPMLSGNREITSNSRYTLNVEDLNMMFVLSYDPYAPAPCPMMMFVYGENSIDLYNKISYQSNA